MMDLGKASDDPLAMTIVVRDTKDFTITQLAKSTALAVASFTPYPFADSSDNWEEWDSTNFRKILKRMKPNKFDTLSEKIPEDVDHEFYSFNGIDLMVMEPVRKSSSFDALKGAQVTHFQTVEENLPKATMFGVPVITLNKDLGMSAGKASVAAAHALQKLNEHLFAKDCSTFQIWNAHKNVHVRWDTIEEDDSSTVVIHDSGFTEVIPGSITAVAKMNGSPILR